MELLIINYTAEENLPGLLLFLDFEKAFDTVEWNFIQKTLGMLGCVLNNGWSTDFFKLERGVRQGCPLSPYLFILCVEVFAEKIRKTKCIKGIMISQNEVKISQYADDTTLFLDGSKESLLSALQVLENFRKMSGLKLNNKKTEALWIGVYKESDVILSPGLNILKEKL